MLNAEIAEKEIKKINTDFEVSSPDLEDPIESKISHSLVGNIKFLIVGILFGIILVKSEVVSWFRIQEMFRFQSFHMYGVIGSAVITGMISVILLKRFKTKTIYNHPIIFIKRSFSKGQIFGGLLFGFGWAMTGACPGPIFALIGSGATVVLITLLTAIAGTWFYGLIREKLPH
ncbi:MAG: transporter [Bacteroidetes bacterium]|nr:MAG: transporter [Bacteroidota bacterium]